MIRAREYWLVGALGVLLAWFYVWTSRTGAGDWGYGKQQTDYYNLLIDGWLDGQLHMKVEVPEALLRLSDPYDPAQRGPGVGMHDASFYRGKYYVYFGVAPAVTLMLPWRMLTGTDLPLAAAVVVFAFGGFLASAAVWLRVRRVYFPTTGTLVVLLGVLLLGVAGLGPVLVRRPHVWELPIAGGYCFGMLALGCLFQALHAPRRQTWWYAGAGLCLGLAVASRATYLFGLGAMLVPLWGGRSEGWRFLLRRAAIGVAPLAVIGLALAAHNYARFADPLEFGQRYQLSAMYESKVTHFAARYAPFNAKLYFWSPAQWSRYFPFIAVTKPAVEPAGYGGTEDVYGLLRNLPIAWLALAAPLALWRRGRDERRALGTWLAALLVLLLPMAVLLQFFFGAHGRYMLDFAPGIMLLAAVGVLAVERVTGARTMFERGAVRAAWASALLFSAGFAALFSLTATHILREKNPRQFAALARVFNRVPAAIERLMGVDHGPAVLTLQFAAGEAGARQTLLTTGRAGARDAVFVQFAGPGQIQLGVAHDGGGTQVSRPIPIDFAASHRLRVDFGAFYPPAAHPLFAEALPAEIARRRTRVYLELDDEIVLETAQDFHASTPADFTLTPDLGNNVLGRRFTGKILKVEREPMAPLTNARPVAEFLRLRLTLPAPGERAQALATFSGGGREDVLALRRRDAGSVQFVWLGAPGAAVESAPLALESREVHEVLVRTTATGDAAGAVALQAHVDGTLAWSRRVSARSGGGAPVAIGKGAEGAEAFAGTIHAHESFREGADPLQAGGGALRLKLRFPSPPLNGRDPLLVTGRAGAGDFFVVDYSTPGAVRFGVDHWGNGRMPQSPPIPIDFAAVHDLEISLGVTPGPAADTAVHANWGDRIIVKLDGREVWNESIDIYVPGPGEFFVGRNPIGGSSCGPAFRGEIFQATRERLPPAPRN